jgi:hypothetical protein
MRYTDNQLKAALAKMLPDVISYLEVTAYESGKIVCLLQWGAEWNDERDFMVSDTELLHLCWLVEETLNSTALLRSDYIGCLSVGIDGWEYGFTHATWQHRVIALAKVKGIEI